MIYIFTGPICSGKTTRLKEWSVDRKDVGGILMPVRNGKRYFYYLNSGEQYKAEAEEYEKEVIEIGPYRFSAKAFENANRNVMESYAKHNVLVIDEIGPIELNGRGFAPSLNIVLNEKKRLDKVSLILVVRVGLVEKVLKNFKICDSKTLTEISGFKL